jgi:hypothetical protein
MALSSHAILSANRGIGQLIGNGDRRSSVVAYTCHLCQRCAAVSSHAIQGQFGYTMPRSHKLWSQHKWRVQASPLESVDLIALL